MGTAITNQARCAQESSTTKTPSRNAQKVSCGTAKNASDWMSACASVMTTTTQAVQYGRKTADVPTASVSTDRPSAPRKYAMTSSANQVTPRPSQSDHAAQYASQATLPATNTSSEKPGKLTAKYASALKAEAYVPPSNAQ